MKQWKPGDEFVEGYRRGKLIKPIPSRQNPRAWLAKVNGYDCIVSLDFIEPPPAEENGQLLLFGELATNAVVDEPPDPDDFSTVDEYNLAFERWNSRQV